MNPQPQRYSRRPLPPYRYTPGGDLPHPVRDPRGHSFGHELPAEALDASRWRECESYLHAIDLFNEGYWWEAHETLEALWHGSGPRSRAGRFLQGLIQLAAACLKHRAGNPPAAERLHERGAPRLLAAGDPFAGIATRALVRDVGEYLAGRCRPAPRIELAD